MINPFENTLSDWHKHPLGAEVLSLEIESLQPLLNNLSGQVLLQLGNSELLNHLQIKCPTQRIIITEQPISQNTLVCSRYTELPLANNSIDLVLLPHILEFAATPQTVLAESWRVLADDGQLVILSFNPWSLCGLYHLFNKKEVMPWQGHFYDAQKWRNQIKQLDGHITFFKYLFFRPPVNKQSFLQQTRWLDNMLQLLLPAAGGIYILVAQKQVIPLVPIKPKLNWSKLLFGEGRLEPTTRGARRNA